MPEGYRRDAYIYIYADTNRGKEGIIKNIENKRK